MSIKSKIESGQALVLVLLSLAVVLTLVLFILSRSVTDISVSSKNSEAITAFSAAEAGIEQALVIGTGGSSTLSNSASFTSSVASFNTVGGSSFNYPIELSSGDSATTWFVAHDASTSAVVCDGARPCFTGNNFKVCWGKPGTASDAVVTPAIEATVFYEATPGDLSTVKIARAAFDPNSGRRSSNSLSAPDAGSCTIDGQNYAFQKTATFSGLGVPAGSYGVQDGLQFVRFRMIYNTDTTQTLGTTVSFAGEFLPSQGQKIVSTGSAGGTAGANRRIEVFQGWPEVPSVFDTSVFSSTGLTK